MDKDTQIYFHQTIEKLPKKTKRAEGTLIIRLLLVGDY